MLNIKSKNCSRERIDTVPSVPTLPILPHLRPNKSPMKTPFFILSALMIGTCMVFSQATRNPSSPVAQASSSKTSTAPVMRYQVIMNLEDGLVVESWRQETSYTAIPGSLGRVGGGGGHAITSTKWEPTGKYYYIAHTPASRDFPNDHIIYAEISETGRTQRISETDVIPIIQIRKLLPAPQSPSKETGSPTAAPQKPKMQPVDPFRKPARR